MHPLRRRGAGAAQTGKPEARNTRSPIPDTFATLTYTRPPNPFKGLGSAMLRAYLNFVKAQGDGAASEVRLLCKQHLVAFYERASFELIGESDVVHGQDTWLEMTARVAEGNP